MARKPVPRGLIMLALAIPVVVAMVWSTTFGTSHVKAMRIDSGGAHACTVLSDGQIACWGNNEYGQLGNGQQEAFASSPERVLEISTAKDVSARTFHTCALLTDGAVKCWGRNDRGQLGDGTFEDSSAPVKVKGISTAIAVETGVFHTCALLSTGEIRCWGYNDFGQLGNGTYNGSNTPVEVANVAGAVDIAAGGDHSCAVLAVGRIECWGWNAHGQLGTGEYQENYTNAAPVVGIENATAVTAGDYHTCALLSGGDAKCWGLNGESWPSAEISLAEGVAEETPRGIAPTGLRLEPRGDRLRLSWNSVGGGATYSVYYATEGDVTPANYASLPHGALHAYLRDTSFELVPSSDPSSYRFVVTAHYSGVDDGQLGDGTYTNARAPVSVLGVSSAIKIEAGYASTCALLSEGDIKCWGRNTTGELGNGSKQPSSNVPVGVAGLSKAIDIAVGGSPCALLSDHTARCWGSNYYGQIGNGTHTDAPVPTEAEFVRLSW